MRKRIALSVLAVAIGTAVALAGNGTAANASASPLSSALSESSCC
jgi:hypothetical protein